MSTEEQSAENKGIQSISEFLETNKNNVLIAGIALILVAGGIYYYNNSYAPAMETEASESLFMAERYFSQDSLDKALNGDGLNLGMKDISDEFGSTSAGNRASFYAGKILLEKGQFEEALGYLSDVSMDDEIMAAQVTTLRGDCYSEMEQYEKAGDTYMKAANMRDNNLTTPYALLKAGAAYEEAGEFDDAKSAYEKLQANYSDSRSSDRVEARIARVEAKLSAE
jgi:predicted negative regulator of RcsB-dependent stress response|tara:strand:+ start:6743 stop:7417 length:675 start_codon:yes stop_codon:yes gene_type:complete